MRVFWQTDLNATKGVCREEEQVLGQADLGGAEAGGDGNACRGCDAQTRHSEKTFCRWKKAYGGLQHVQARELKQLQEENARPKELVADLSLDEAILKVSRKKVGRAAVKREAVPYMLSRHRISIRRACDLVKMRRSVHYYRSVKDPKLALRKRMRALAQMRIRYGYRRSPVLLRREVWDHGRSQTYGL